MFKYHFLKYLSYPSLYKEIEMLEVTASMLLILALIAFIIGLIVGVSLTRPNIR